jgi:membrane fusion protein, multidrug efflux system
MLKFHSLFILAVLAHFSMGLNSCSSKESTSSAGNSGVTTNVEFVILSAENKSIVLDLPGEIIPEEHIDLVSEISGRILTINFKEGASVSKGQELFRIDTDILQAERKKVLVDKQLAEKDLNRKRQLFESKAISAEILEQTEASLEVLDAQLQLLDVQISRGTIRAPFSGRVGLRNVSEGAYVAAGTMLTTLTKNENAKIEFTVPQRYASFVKTEQVIRYAVGNDSTKYNAAVFASTPAVDGATRTLRIRAIGENPSAHLPGSFVKVNYDLGAQPNTLMIPTYALVPVLNGQHIWQMKNGKAHRVDVEIGMRSDKDIQILGDISAGDTVITTGLLGLREGMAVTPKVN